jgi:SAM-dependent methyltransferase
MARKLTDWEESMDEFFGSYTDYAAQRREPVGSLTEDRVAKASLARAFLTRVKDGVRRHYNSGADRLCGVSTIERPVFQAGAGQNSHLGDHQKYVPIDYLALAYLFSPISFGVQDVFVDIGCGLGRAVLAAARKPIRRSIGIEYDAMLAHVAQQNANSLRWARAPIEIRHQDAAQADYDEGTIFWMYNPFGLLTLANVLDSIRLSLSRVPRSLVIAYAHPEHASEVDRQSWLRRIGERRFPGAGENGYAIYWTT